MGRAVDGQEGRGRAGVVPASAAAETGRLSVIGPAVWLGRGAMTILPLHPSDHASPEALRDFLAGCQAAAVKAGRPRLVSISLAVEALDPLAVLEQIFDPREPHFYAEQPAVESALAGAEVAASVEAEGPDRFAEVKRWADALLDGAIAVGDVTAPFGGPHVFAGFTFAERAEPGEPFPAAFAFVPRWQVARAGNTTTAVANLLVAPDADLAPLTERVWRAHAKFRTFGFGEPPAAGADEVGGGFATQEVGDYAAAVIGALASIARGECQKIVLARAKDVTARRQLHPLRVLNGLRQRFPECHAFSFTRGGGTSFIGASPERLVRVSRGVLETEALAGSMRRGGGASEDAALGAALMRSEKDRREHEAVLRDIVARLEEVGITVETPATPRLRRLANVQHLLTPLRATVPDGVRLLDLVAAMHPTPAVGGSPREAAVARIRKLEGFPRGLYAGALGWMNARGGGEFFVGIRSALVEGAQCRVFAGAGIVAGSAPDKEFAETELKFAAMLEALGV
jgi:menaquinone-specific isochorismate synthase